MEAAAIADLVFAAAAVKIGWAPCYLQQRGERVARPGRQRDGQARQPQDAGRLQQPRAAAQRAQAPNHLWRGTAVLQGSCHRVTSLFFVI